MVDDKNSDREVSTISLLKVFSKRVDEKLEGIVEEYRRIAKENKEDHNHIERKLDQQNGRVSRLEKFAVDSEVFEEIQAQVDARINRLENWKSYVVGALTMLGSVLGTVYMVFKILEQARG